MTTPKEKFLQEIVLKINRKGRVLEKPSKGMADRALCQASGRRIVWDSVRVHITRTVWKQPPRGPTQFQL